MLPRPTLPQFVGKLYGTERACGLPFARFVVIFFPFKLKPCLLKKIRKKHIKRNKKDYSLSHSSNAATLNRLVSFFLFPLSPNLRYLCVCMCVCVCVCVFAGL